MFPLAMDPSEIPCITKQAHSFGTHCFDPSDQPALPLYIPPTCVLSPPHRFHFPSPGQPLRIRVSGPLLAIQRLIPDVPWQLPEKLKFPLPGAVKLVELVFRALYHRHIQPDIAGDMTFQHDCPGWMIDFYGITFDHLVPPGDTNPEVIVINIIEVEDDDGVFINNSEYLPFKIDPKEYIGQKVLAVPRCCQHRRGTTDRPGINEEANVWISGVVNDQHEHFMN